VTYVKNPIPFTELPNDTQTCESLTIQIANIRITNYYTSPSRLIDTNELHNLIHSHSRTITMGDFNSSHAHWNSQHTSQNGRRLHDYLFDSPAIVHYPTNNYTHFPDAQNHRPATLDILITKNIQTRQPIAHTALQSDHLPVTAVITLSQQFDLPPQKHTTHTNWEQYRHHIEHNVNTNLTLTDNKSIDSAISDLTKLIQIAYKNSTKTKPSPQHTLDLPEHITQLIRTKNTMRAQLRRRHDPALKQEVQQLTQSIRQEVQNIRNTKWENTLKTITKQDKTKLWTLARSFKNTRKHMPALHSTQGQAISCKQKADTIAEAYTKHHNLTQHLSDQQTTQIVQDTYNTVTNTVITTPKSDLTSIREIHDILKALRNRKAPGQDTITNSQLKNLPKQALHTLEQILNQCLNNQYFPKPWRHAIVLPILKPNKPPSRPESYRPISLLSSLSKILEKVILNRLQRHENTNPTLIEQQYGFKPKHSTTLQLANLTEQITTNYNQNRTTTVMTLDIEKAFDTVWHTALIHKLHTQKLPTHLVKIIQSFLKDRAFQVQVSGTNSQNTPLPAGVPQGSILSPTLFLYYINDIPQHPQTKISLFADDTAVIAQSTLPNQTNKYLQRHIQLLEPYYNKWKIQINTDKTKLTYYNTLRPNTRRSSIKTPVTFYNIALQHQKSTKYLGVTLDRKLTYTEHITAVSNAAHQAIRTLHPLLTHKNSLCINTKLYIYKAYIRPIITYAAPIFSNTCKSNYTRLQRVQNKALKIITNAPDRTNMQTIHNSTNMPTIQEHIQHLTQKFYYFTTKKLPHTQHLGTLNKTNAPFNIKYKLPHHVLMT
jgi:Reverse transcriptase (RNA-dependent DNA polymerase)/Endonuclease-reverse transcriptase